MSSPFRSPAYFSLMVILCLVGAECLGQECWLNNPFYPFVKSELLLEREGVKLKLRNDFHQAVALTEVLLTVEGSDSSVLLPVELVSLPPADRHYLDITHQLHGCFQGKSGRQEKTIRIRLGLSPTPPDQPQECAYRIALENKRFVKCERVSSETGIGDR